ncbi:bacterioferritin-associated ferredoxin [Saccharibacter sp. 17.LH.SD]|uniref:(2Fe-2S)-binding protein n=1 Tax=Saccharibacter sp. 17.LH.SD TaxID=2689393 RepID=UPI001F4612A9|nr:bacterioferritin [Saccharibacter sp. 17.LH.SD]
MIVCSCNALSDKDVDAAIQSGVCRTAEVYAVKKCRVQCGQCVPGIVCRLKEALKRQRECVVESAEPAPCVSSCDAALASLELEARALESEQGRERVVSALAHGQPGF